MKNKHLLILILIAFMIFLFGLIINLSGDAAFGSVWVSLGLSFVNLLGINLLVKNGTLRKTTYFKLISVFIGLLIFGAMFKVMHWPGASIILIISLIGIPLIYTIHFLKKTIKNILDFLKLAWVLTPYIAVLFVIMNWGPKELTYLSNIIMLFSIIHFALICIKNKVLFES